MAALWKNIILTMVMVQSSQNRSSNCWAMWSAYFPIPSRLSCIFWEPSFLPRFLQQPWFRQLLQCPLLVEGHRSFQRTFPFNHDSSYRTLEPTRKGALRPGLRAWPPAWKLSLSSVQLRVDVLSVTLNFSGRLSATKKSKITDSKALTGTHIKGHLC